MSHINASETEVQKWLDASPGFAQDLHNLDVIDRHIGVLERQLGRWPNLAEVAAYINTHSDQYHWIQSGAEPSKAEIRGTAEQKLYQLGIPVSGRLSHADKLKEDAAKTKQWSDVRNQAAKERSEGERRKAIRDAEQHREFYSDGRINWPKTNEVRAQKLAALGLGCKQ